MATTAGMTRLRQAMENARRMDAGYSAGNDRIETAMRNAAELDRREEEARQRMGTVQSMKNRRLEIDERSLGKPLPTAGNRQTVQPGKSQAVQPGKSLMEQATANRSRKNFDAYNRDYDRDMGSFNENVAQVTMLRNMGIHDPAAEQALQDSRNTITGTQNRWGTLMRQTLDDLGQETEGKFREMVEEGEGSTRYRELYREMFEKFGADLTRDLTEYVRQQQNAETMEQKKQEAAAYGREHGVKASVASVPKKVLGGVVGTLDTFRQGADRLFSGSNAPVDWNAPAQTMGREASAIRGSVSQKLDEQTGNGVASFLYNTGMSMLDSAAVLPMGGWGSVVLGTAAANDAMQEAKANGATDDQAMALGTISGVAEVLTEKVSIDSLFSLEEAKTARQVVGNIIKQAIPEASEEAISSVINLFADKIILGEKSRYEQLVQEQMEQNGLNRDQAAARAFLTLAGDVGLDALGGAISGGLFATGKAAGQAVGRGVSGRFSGRGTDAEGRNVIENGQNVINSAESGSQVMTREQTDAAMLAALEQLQQGTNQTGEPMPVSKSDTGGAKTEVTVPKTDDLPDTPLSGMQAVGAAETGFSGEIGTWKRDAKDFIKETELPKKDKEGGIVSDSAGSMFASNVPKETKEMVERFAYEGELSYGKDTNKAQVERVHREIEQDGFDAVYERAVQDMLDGKANADLTARSWVLFVQAANRGDDVKAATLAKIMQSNRTDTAKALQANAIYSKLSPEGRLMAIMKTVNRINDEISDKKQKGVDSRKADIEQVAETYGDTVKIDPKLMQEYLDARGEEAIAAAEKKIYQDIGRQIPATFEDKWNAWRYLSMLGNFRTHGRNILGNAMFSPVRGAKNLVGTGMEAIAQKAGWIDQSQRTKSVGVGKDRIEAARADYENVKDLVLSGDKWNSASSTIEESRRIFKNPALEAVRKKNSELLDLEDNLFSKRAYASSLAGYLKAQGFTAADFTGGGMTSEQKSNARAYAIREAQKATYRDLNAFSGLVNKIGFKNPKNKLEKGLNTLVEGVLPFRKTPANILARGVEYSPAGLVKALSVDIHQVANGKISASEYMDRLASGLTGTGLFALGMLLSKMGILTGGTPEDEEQAELEGWQPYAIEVGGKSFTLDWLAPEALPVFMGVELMETLTEDETEAPAMDKVINSLKGLSDPMLEMSMLSSLQDALEATEYADSKLTSFFANSALGYFKQAFPTIFGQLERTFGKRYRETTFTQEGDKWLNKDAQYTIGSIANKVPLWDYRQIPYIDAWGRMEDQGGTATRAVNNLINPSFVSELTETDVDKEIKRLEKETGKNYTPNRAEKVLTIDGRKVILTADEYVTYATAKGQNDFTLRTNLIGSDGYAALDDATKGKAMECARDYANTLAQEETGLNPLAPEWMTELEGADAETVTKTLLAKAIESQVGPGEKRYEDLAERIGSGVPAETVLAALTKEQQKNYSTYIQPAGVPADVYLDVLGFEAGTESDKDKNGDTIAGSKKQKVVDYINGMNLSKKQKRALFLCFYSEKDTTFK